MDFPDFPFVNYKGKIKEIHVQPTLRGRISELRRPISIIFGVMESPKWVLLRNVLFRKICRSSRAPQKKRAKVLSYNLFFGELFICISAKILVITPPLLENLILNKGGGFTDFAAPGTSKIADFWLIYPLKTLKIPPNFRAPSARLGP